MTAAGRPAADPAIPAGAKFRVGAASAGAAYAWVFVAGLLTEHPARVPAAVGGLVLGGVAPGSAAPLGLRLVVFAAAVFLGCVALAALALLVVREAAHASGLLVGAAFVFILIQLAVAVCCLILTDAGLGGDAWLVLFGANAAGAAAAGWLVRRHHPELAREFANDDAEDPAAAPSDVLAGGPTSTRPAGTG